MLTRERGNLMSRGKVHHSLPTQPTPIPPASPSWMSRLASQHTHTQPPVVLITCPNSSRLQRCSGSTSLPSWLPWTVCPSRHPTPACLPAPVWGSCASSCLRIPCFNLFEDPLFQCVNNFFNANIKFKTCFLEYYTSLSFCCMGFLVVYCHVLSRFSLQAATLTGI